VALLGGSGDIPPLPKENFELGEIWQVSDTRYWWEGGAGGSFFLCVIFFFRLQEKMRTSKEREGREESREEGKLVKGKGGGRRSEGKGRTERMCIQF